MLSILYAFYFRRDRKCREQDLLWFSLQFATVQLIPEEYQFTREKRTRYVFVCVCLSIHNNTLQVFCFYQLFHSMRQNRQILCIFYLWSIKEAFAKSAVIKLFLYFPFFRIICSSSSCLWAFFTWIKQYYMYFQIVGFLCMRVCSAMVIAPTKVTFINKYSRCIVYFPWYI